MRAFDIKYWNTRLGAPCIKFHRFIAKNEEEARKGLVFWKGPSVIISIEDKGEFNPEPGFTFKA